MISPEDLSSSSFEVIATLDFVAESTGITTQARTSYLPSEILWGFRSDIHIVIHNYYCYLHYIHIFVTRFENFKCTVKKEKIYVDLSRLNHTVAIQTPRNPTDTYP